MRVALQVILQLFLLAAVQPVSSQSPFARLPDGPATGVSLERFRYEDGGSITAVSFHLSRLQHNSGGMELGLAVFPQYLAIPALVTAPDAGFGVNLSLPAVTLLLRGGAGAIVGLGHGVNVFYPGAHLGGGALIHVDQRLALRVDVLRRWYVIDGGTEPYWSIGLGFSVLGSRRP